MGYSTSYNPNSIRFYMDEGIKKMSLQEERKCPHCNRVFWVNGFRFCCARTLSCYYCGKRFKVKEAQL